MAVDRKTQIILALITAVVTLVVGYWEFVYKPQHTDPDNKTDYQGRVINNKSEQGVARAKIIVMSKGVPPSVYTDNNGVFHLQLAGAPSSVRVSVEADGYEPFNQFVPLSNDQFEEIRLKPQMISPSPAPAIQASPSNDNTSAHPAAPHGSRLRTKRGDTSQDLLERRQQAINALNNTSPTPQPSPRH